MRARRSYVKITYEGKDITGEVTPYLQSASYTDNLDKGDSATFNLMGDKWINEWAVLKGDKFELEIGVINWKGEGDNRILKCGTFTVDDISFSGVPDKVSISGTSVDINKGLKSVSRDSTWENVSLRKIAQEIADRNSMNLFYDCDTEFLFDKVDQVKESDTQLLYRISKEQGATLKITDLQIIIFDEEKYEKVESVLTFLKPNLMNYEIKCDDFEIYDCCEITYYDPELGESLKGSFEAPASEFYKVKTGKILYKNIDTGVTGGTKEEKEKFLRERARKLLRSKNKHETEIKFKDMGDVSYLAGMTITLNGFGRYSGVYLITSVEHSLDGAYQCSISARRRIDF
ncbi:hypothetical protein PM10SUCC1_28790 [Propionigenium maris DSM 9537]|uniref:Phage protein D n=1 Tax=Propionigenium maris DSM 9537 TaxID=1123000 RepID=A0A9W6LPU3_9FUSO|nr:hypothetical protein [Propionigenium maris]GLI57365.1 hypothetical protein PM10SUCC1_28790 [Propionigenium maris DSM 9537]